MQCTLFLLVISQSFWPASANDWARMVRKSPANQASRMEVSVSPSAEIEVMEKDYEEVDNAELLDTRVNDLLSEVEALARSNTPPKETAKIAVIKKIVTDELVPDLKKTRDAAQKQVGENNKSILKCNSNSQATQQSIKSSTEVKVGEARTSHSSCRMEEKTKHGTKSSKCAELDSFLDAINNPADLPNGKPRAQMVEYVKTMSNYYCPKGPTVTQLDDACTHATNQHSTHKAECDRQQAAFELGFCTWRTELTDECKALKTCYDDAVKIYNDHVSATKVLVKKWKTEYAALQKIICYTDVWLNDANAKTVDTAQLDKCNTNTVDTSSMNVQYPDVPAKATCDLTPVQIHPGTDSFPKTEYSNFAKEVSKPIACLGYVTQGTKSIEIQYSVEMTKGKVGKDSQQCKDWQSLHSKIDSKAGYISVGVGSVTRTCDDPTVANQILEHFTSKDKSRKSYKCGSHTWWVGNCGAGSHLSLEICVDCPKICHCTKSPKTVTLRPCINNHNWGGHGQTCGGSTTTLSLTTTAKQSSSMLSSAEFDQELEEDGDDSWKYSSDPALIE